MNNHSINILLVEDNPADARLIFELLKDGRGERYELEHVDRFSKAKERLKRNTVDVVLLDLSLPDSHGLDTLMRLNGHTDKMPVIVLTGMDDQALAITALQVGAQDYLVKGQVDSELLWRSMRYAIERKKAEEAQQASEEKYSSILEEMGEDYHELDDKGNLTFFNNTLCRHLGYTRGELQGSNYKIYTPRESWKEIVTAYSEVFRTGKPRLLYPMQVIRKDGTRIFVERSIFPLKNKDGTATGLRVISRDVTERKLSEEIVKRTQKDLQLMIDSLPFGLIIVSIEDRRIRHANHAALEMAGYKSMDQLFDRVCHQTLCPAANGQCPILDLGQRIDRSEGIIVTRTGQKIPILKTVIKLKIDDEDVLLESFVNIAPLKKAEVALKQSNDYLEKLINNGNAPIMVWDAQHNISLFNKAFELLTGYKADYILGKQMDILFPSDKRGDLFKYIKNAVEGEAWESQEIPILCADGTMRTVLWNMASLYAEDGKTTISTIAQGLDITERIKAEKEIEERERLYRTLIETSPDAIGLMDLNGNILMHNKQALEVFGFDTSEDLRGQNMLNLVAPEKREEIFQKTELITKGGVLKNLELGSYKKNGQPFYVELSSSALLDEEKKPESVIVVFKDITNRKLAEEELANSYRKLRKTLNDAINTLVKVVEMRDPYTAGHQQRVAALAIAIANKLKLNDSRIEELRMAAVIHDIGKIYVPSDMLSKPGKLTDLEFEIIKTHARGGYEIVKSMDFPYVVAHAILQHHERLDGSGYPQGLKGDAIILEARILAVADVVEAMASHRPYRPGLGIDKALDEIQKNAGKFYDPEVADACIKLFKEDEFKFEQSST